MLMHWRGRELYVGWHHGEDKPLSLWRNRGDGELCFTCRALTVIWVSRRVAERLELRQHGPRLRLV